MGRTGHYICQPDTSQGRAAYPRYCLSWLKDHKQLKAVYIVYYPMTMFAKLSILLLFFRLFSAIKIVRTWIYVGIITTVLHHTISTILAIALCIPSDAMGYARCNGRLRILGGVTSAINVVSDFYILILPLVVISRLHLRPGKKFGACAVFLTGFLYGLPLCQRREGLQTDSPTQSLSLRHRCACLPRRDMARPRCQLVVGPPHSLRVSLERFQCQIHKIHPISPAVTKPDLFRNPNSLLEVNVGLIVGSMPILPALLRHDRGLKSLGRFFSTLRSPLSSLRNVRTTKQAGSIGAKSKESHLMAGTPVELGFRHTSKDSESAFTLKGHLEATHEETSWYEPVTMV